MDYTEIEVSLFNDKSDKKPKRAKLIEVLNDEREGRYRDTIEKIRNEPDKEKRKRLKSTLPAFTPSGVFEGGHAMQHFVSHSGLLFFDFDDKDNQADNFADLPKLAEAIPNILYCGKSVGGKGYHVIIPIANVDQDNHRAYYTTLCQEFKKCGLFPDMAAKDITRLCFVSYDPEANINLEAVPLELDEVVEGQEPGGNLGTTLEPDPSLTDLYGTCIEVAMLIERARIKKEARIKELAKNIKAEEQTEKEEPKTANPEDEKKKKKDITEFADPHEEWVGVSFAFALSFGEEMGRPLFHAYSELSGKYDHSEVDKQFSTACQSTLQKLSSGMPRKGLMSVGSFFRLCQEYGLMQTRLERDFGNLDISQLSGEANNNLSADDEDL